jgi:hypothetical protein
MTDLEIMRILMEEMEGEHTHLRVSRGYGAGHPHFEKAGVKQVLGTSDYPAEDEPEKPKQPQKVQVSKAFKK